MQSNAHSFERVPKNSTKAWREHRTQLGYQTPKHKLFQCLKQDQQAFQAQMCSLKENKNDKTHLRFDGVGVYDNTLDINQLCIMLHRHKRNLLNC